MQVNASVCVLVEEQAPATALRDSGALCFIFTNKKKGAIPFHIKQFSLLIMRTTVGLFT